ncbi:unnamed protein product [Prunus armeniaca]|uniref:Uncharacterized protein n=1 Tax=Prunus armeniaca TaxID=36596 RepID=A0A6J5W7B7_PRUAR|nr:unnamed protein product [Prunus armeniaca]
MGVKQDGDGTILPPTELEKIPDGLDVSVKKFLRGSETNLEGQLAIREELYGKSAQAAAKAEKWLLPSKGGYLEAEGMEKTWRIKQESIALNHSESCSEALLFPLLYFKAYLGPCTLDFTSSGRHMAVRETVCDVVFLHNESFFAAAQKNYPYIYNPDGTELHCLKEHGAVLRLQFLKTTSSLASINNFGQLHYQDVTMGEMVGSYRTGLGRADVMQVDPYDGVVALGHSLGTVSMWKPTSSAPLLKRPCHRSPISAMAFHPNGHLMATAGKENKIKLWDLRKLEDEALQTLPGQAKTLEFSQKGLLACLGCGSSV